MDRWGRLQPARGLASEAGATDPGDGPSCSLLLADTGQVFLVFDTSLYSADLLICIHGQRDPR